MTPFTIVLSDLMNSAITFSIEMLTNTSPLTYLPGTNALYCLTKRTLHGAAQLEGIAADLDDVVDECTHGGHGEGGGEQGHVAKLDQHLQVVLERVFILKSEEYRC